MFIDRWTAGRQRTADPIFREVAICGLGKESVFMLVLEEGDKSRAVADAFVSHMGMTGQPCVKYLGPEEMKANAMDILSLPILFPKIKNGLQLGHVDPKNRDLLEVQTWLHGEGLIGFPTSEGFRVPQRKLSSGAKGLLGYDVVCKHVHVPGLGPEIDVSPAGVNKGSAMLRLMENPVETLGIDFGGEAASGRNNVGSTMAVFGDAANDVELFGMRRSPSGNKLEPLPGTEESKSFFRPPVRCAMSWANDTLLMRDATVLSKMHEVLREMLP
jgi:hypothetical protein